MMRPRLPVTVAADAGAADVGAATDCVADVVGAAAGGADFVAAAIPGAGSFGTVVAVTLTV